MPDATTPAFDREVLARLPRAEAVLTLGAFLWGDDQLNDFYENHRADSYGRRITFPDFVGMIRDALLHHGGSLAAALDRSAETVVLPASRQAFYAKLRRVPPALSTAWLRETTRRLAPIRPAEQAAGLPKSLAGFALHVIDGKALKRVPKRLLACRGAAGKLSGAKILGCWDPRSELVLAVAVACDGEANECTLVPELLQQVRSLPTTQRRLWIADRQFGDLTQTARCAESGDAVLIRRNAKTTFTPDPRHPPRIGRDAAGRTVVDQWGTLGRGPQARSVRQITLERPSDPVVLVTNLEDETAYPATDLLALYLRRWGIEQVYQRVVEVFGLARFIGSSPEATIFQAAYCLSLSNLIEVVRAVAATSMPEVETVDQVSVEKFFEDVREELLTLHRLVAEPDVVRMIPRLASVAAVRQHLGALLSGAWRERYRKATRPPGRAHPEKAKQSGAHTSVFRLQQKHRQRLASQT